MAEYKNILVVQTAFLGDVILTLPLVQTLKNVFPDANIDFVAVPRAAHVLRSHPDIRQTIVYDKRGSDAGIAGLLRMRRTLRANTYGLALVPHRSLRSAVLVAAASIPRRIGFNASAGRFLFTDTVRYEKSLHEVDRNARLLDPLNIVAGSKDFPHLYPSREDCAEVDRFLFSQWKNKTRKIIGIAPGTVWNTKRWPTANFIELADRLRSDGFHIVLVGGEEDTKLCSEICSAMADSSTISAAGKLTVLQSAELIRRCRLLVSNDSAPVHLAVAVQTPVVAIFGATVPEFGFAPYGQHDVVVETKGLSCRPCSIHGGDACPISTFDCMKRIPAYNVYQSIRAVLDKVGTKES